jgi:hypothetical protein
MASVVYNSFKQRSANGTIDLDTDTIWVALLMTNTTADTENDGVADLADFTTLDEMDGAAYVRKALTSLAVNLDDANDRAEFDAADVTWTALGAGTRSIQGALVYVDADNDGDPADDALNFVIAFIDFTSDIIANGGDVTIQWNAEGILQLA